VRRTLVVVYELGRFLIAPQAIFFRSHHQTGKLIGVSAVRKIGDLQSCERRQRRVSDLPAADATVGPMKSAAYPTHRGRRLRQRVADLVVCGARTCDEERGQPRARRIVASPQYYRG
jgi:hypothetical protein